MPRSKTPNADVPVTFRLPVDVQSKLLAKARREDLNFSQLVRRAIRRELNQSPLRSALAKLEEATK